MKRWLVLAAVVAGGVCGLGVTTGYAQRIVSGFYGNAPPRFATEHSFQGSAFTSCRAMFQSNRREKRGWSTDYPMADINFPIRLAELTRTRIARQPGSLDPEYVVVRLTDEELFRCPYVLFVDAGTIDLDEAEIKNLREYLLKGGFLFVSDYWGEEALEQFDYAMDQVLPRRDYPIIPLTIDHPIWQTHFRMSKIPQMPSIQSWRRSGGDTDRGVTDPPNPRAIVDPKGRLMVVMLHNSDIPDGWEREGEDPEYFYRFSPDAYQVGINVLLHAMTH